MDAKIIERRDVIRGARDRWLSQYKNYQDTQVLGWDRARTAGDARRALSVLDLEKASVDDVAAAIGASGWGSLTCDLCDGDFESLKRIGEDPDYEARWVDICDDCLRTVCALKRPTATETNMNESGTEGDSETNKTA